VPLRPTLAHGNCAPRYTRLGALPKKCPPKVATRFLVGGEVQVRGGVPAEPPGVAEAAANDPPLGAREPLDAPQAGVLQVLHKLVPRKPGVVQSAVEPLVQAPPPHLEGQEEISKGRIRGSCRKSSYMTREGTAWGVKPRRAARKEHGPLLPGDTIPSTAGALLQNEGR
jgi:hypothetical protein